MSSITTQAKPTAGTRHGIMILATSIMPVMAIIALVPVLPMLLKEFASVKGHPFLVPIALTVPALCVALFSPVAGWLSDRLGRKNLLVAATSGMSLSTSAPKLGILFLTIWVQCSIRQATNFSHLLALKVSSILLLTAYQVLVA